MSRDDYDPAAIRVLDGMPAKQRPRAEILGSETGVVARIRYAAQVTLAEVREQFTPNEGAWSITGMGFSGAALMGGGALAWKGAGRAGILLDLVVGCFSTTVVIGLGYAGLLLFATVGAFLRHLRHGPRRPRDLDLRDKALAGLGYVPVTER